MGQSTSQPSGPVLVFLALVVVLAGGCRGEEELLVPAGGPQRGAPDVEAEQQAAEAPASQAPDAEASEQKARIARCYTDLVDEYEAVREEIAKPNLTAAKRASSRLAASAKTMAKACGGPLKDVLDRLARDGTSFGAAPDLTRARETFGDISRGMLEVAARQPDLAEGLRAYHCPSLEGYGRWLQRSGEPANPYLAPEAPACAAPTDLRP